MNPKANNSKEALGLLQSSQKNLQSPQAYLGQANQQFGVDAARQNVMGLRGAVDRTSKLLQNVAPSVTGRTRNSLVNSAAANRIIANEQAPIATNLANQSNAYNQAFGDLGSLESRAAQQAQMAYQGQQDQQSFLQNLYNTLYQREQGEKTFNEQQRQFNEQLKLSQAKAGGDNGLGNIISQLFAGNKPTVESLFQGYDPKKDRMYTEQIVIPTLVQYGYSPEKASKLAYDYRKKSFGE